MQISSGGVRGLDSVRILPEVVDLVQKEYGGNQSSGTRPHDIAFVLFVVDSDEQLNAVIEKIKSLITVESVDEGYLPIASFDAVNKVVRGCNEQ